MTASVDAGRCTVEVGSQHEFGVSLSEVVVVSRAAAGEVEQALAKAGALKRWVDVMMLARAGLGVRGGAVITSVCLVAVETVIITTAHALKLEVIKIYAIRTTVYRRRRIVGHTTFTLMIRLVLNV